MKRVALRIQGTSSLAYPRKNFRFYTRVEESSLVYDYEGNLIPDKLYQFIDNAQPVDCWCLKADFAESSGTHNTGIARIWNKVMYGAVIQHTNILGEETNGYALRTEAQKIALEQDYKNDVRTTIDGFPIVLFYKQKESDTDLIFLGKYNFNNDKSTPSVFGFENIPGFNNARMQCWETKDNGHPLGLFTDVSNFDADWAEAYESRYPDTKTPNTADLKAFSQWMNSVSQEDFVTQKWEHMDVYKVAAYYVYAMRFGAVDQLVKNGFLTSEDGVHFYYINYDNDTINGLINTGELRLDPTITRQTIGTDGEYVYAGHSSVLWNRCEADTEFMDIVSIVDNALYSAGLRYDEIMNVFNNEQCDKWAERVYNQDAEYKYLLPYVNQATNNLFMLQGSRSSHRSWWLSKRFALYDSLFVSGAYRDRNVSFKCLNDTQPGQKFTITAGTDMNYGYGVNNGIRETGVALVPNQSYTFTTTDTLNLGDVVKIFGASDLTELDLSQMAARLAVLDCSAAADTVLGSKMKKLLIGGNGNVNTELSSISGINKLTSLQELNIEDYQAITSLDLTALKDMRKVYAHGSGVASIDFAPGTPIEHLELPSAMMALNFNQLPYLTNENIIIENGFANIGDIAVSNCPNISNDFSFVTSWLSEKTIEDADSSLKMDNVEWLNVSAADFIEFSRHKQNGLKMTLQGYVYLNSLTADDVMSLKAIWGNDCFNENSDFYISAPPSIYITPGIATVNEGDSLQFEVDVIPAAKGTVSYRIVSGSREGVTIDANTGLFTTIENGLSDANIYIRAIYTSESGETTYSTASVNVRKRIYPAASTISVSGNTTIAQDEIYQWETSAEGINGSMNVDWSLSGAASTDGYVELVNTSYNNCTIKFIKASEPNTDITGTLNLTITKKVDNSVIATKSLSFIVAKYTYPTADDTVLNGASQPVDNPVYTWGSTATGNVGPFSAEWSLDEALLPYYEIDSIEWDENNPLYGSCTLKKIMDVEFYVKGNINLTITYLNSGTSFTLSKEIYFLSPDVIMTSETNAPVLAALYEAGLCANANYMTKQEAEAVQDSSFNPSGTETGSIFYANNSITSFDEFRYFTSMTTLDAYAFYRCYSLESLKVPNTVVNFGKYCCWRNNTSVALTIDNINVETIAGYAFKASTSTEGDKGSIKINNVNWYCTETCSSTRIYLFDCTQIMNLNVYNISAGYNSTGSSYKHYQHFYNARLMNVVFDESITSIPQYAFCYSYIYGLELSDNITSIATYAFYAYNNTGFNVNKMSKNITTLGSNAFQYPVFKTDVSFDYLTFNTNTCISTATYEGKLDLSGNTSGGSTFNWNQLFSNYKSCAELWLPERSLSYNTTYSSSNLGRLYIPNIANFCASTFSSDASPSSFANEIYTKYLNSDEYIQITDFDPNNWLISSIPAYAFYGCKAFLSYNATIIKNHNSYVFYGSAIQQLQLDNFNGAGTIGSYAFGNCTSLKTIIDNSTQPWATLNNLAFSGVKADVTINSQVFGLYKQSSGFTLSPMANDVVNTLAFGEYTFTCPEGAAFSDGTTSKTLTLGFTGAIEDLTDRLKIDYLTLVLSSNKKDAQFTLSYTSSNGTENIDTVTAGSHLLNVTKGTNITITPVSDYNGWVSPTSSTITMGSEINSTTINYTEETNIYIAHKDGSLYTTDEWVVSGNSNDDAEGVCVIRSESGGFVIAKELSSEENNWGPSYGYGLRFRSTLDLARNDLDGYGNTKRILDKNGTDAIAAITATDYPFPSGEKGYLPAMGELMYIVDNYKNLKDVFGLMGSTLFTKHGNSWSSTAKSGSSPNLKVWYIYWDSYSISHSDAYIGRTKDYDSYVLSFHPARLLKISSTLKTLFTITFTDINGNTVTQKISDGNNFLSIKYGTQVTITPDAIGNITAEPQTFTWTGFTHECNFVFAKDTGVYIQHVNGSFYTESEWTDGSYINSDANGVAILGSDNSFVIAKEDVSSSKLYWGG